MNLFKNNYHQYDYDVAIIGTGGGGMAAAIGCADDGKKVALIEAGTIGGTCVNEGCIPSKTLLRAAEAAHNASACVFKGMNTQLNNVRWNELLQQKNELVEKLRKHKYENVLEHYNNVTFIRGKASLLSDHCLYIDDKHKLTFENLVIATGSTPRYLNIAGSTSSDFLNSTQLLQLEEIPKELVILGGRFIALEMGFLFNRLGSQVTIVQRSSALIPDHEPEISASIRSVLESEGIQVYTDASPIDLQYNHKGNKILRIRNQNKDINLAATHILQAVGRIPNTHFLNLERAGIQQDDDDAIIVNSKFQTNRPHIYAVGDVTPLPKLVYLAAKSGAIAAKDITGQKSCCTEASEIDLRTVPEVIFTDPQVAKVGYTESQARSKGFNVIISTLPMEQVPRAIVSYKTQGVIKLIADQKNRQLLGAHIVGTEAGEMIQTAAMAIRMGFDYGFTLDQFREMSFPYLTAVEGLKLTAQTFDKDVKKLSCCAG